MNARRRIAILGGTGYVAGEMLRLIAGHPQLELASVGSASRAGLPVAGTFGNLAYAMHGRSFDPPDAILEQCADGAIDGVFCATPHGAAAPLVAEILERCGSDVPHIVDASADFRFRDADRYMTVYGAPHPAPDLLDAFSCALPEHMIDVPTRHVSHPGCFATAMLLSVVPLLRAGLATPDFFVAGITGSTGSGRKAIPGTHHPERHSNLYAYKPLSHRHAPEVEELARQASGVPCHVRFVPHSGPFARGIHVTVQARVDTPVDLDALIAAFASIYASSPFVELSAAPPRLKDVVGSNRARVHVTHDEETCVVMTVIDNLMKGAAGGALQWMNRLLGLPETGGLDAPGPAWT